MFRRPRMAARLGLCPRGLHRSSTCRHRSRPDAAERNHWRARRSRAGRIPRRKWSSSGPAISWDGETPDHPCPDTLQQDALFHRQGRTARGVVYEAGVKLEEHLNKVLKTTPATMVRRLRADVARRCISRSSMGAEMSSRPTSRSRRNARNWSTSRSRTNSNQIVVTGPGSPAINTLDDLAGKQVGVREKSLQFDSLTQLNARLKKEGKAEIVIKTVPSSLEDEDILEMVNSGLLKAAVVDDLIAEFWKLILPNLNPRPAVVVRSEGAIAVAVLQEQPEAACGAEPIRQSQQSAPCSAMRSSARNASRTRPTRRTRPPMPKSRSSGRWSSCSRSYWGQVRSRLRADDGAGLRSHNSIRTRRSRRRDWRHAEVMPATGKELQVGDICWSMPTSTPA